LEGFNGVLTTGATAGNILGLAVGREWSVFVRTGRKVSLTGEGGCRILHAGGHSSLGKASSILGIGRQNCISLTSSSHPANFDLERLSLELHSSENSSTGQIVVATFGEVNTGTFTASLKQIAHLCKRYKAWLHVDAAFGILARIHPTFHLLASSLELADSISFDAHKFFNVPYDCGVFLTRDLPLLKSTCGNGTAGYLADDFSPLNLGIENSRRFRALPLYASLLSLGRSGYQDLVVRCCNLAKRIADAMLLSGKLKLLWPVEFNIVLFQVCGYESVERNGALRDGINAAGGVYVSSTVWKGEGGLRIAVCSWLTPEDVEGEAKEVVSILLNAVSKCV
jgi:glutamate/tyrosine decarboxylase-like PLP-dependent enzyme